MEIYRGQRKYDDELPLNKNTPNLDFPRPIDDPAPYVVVVQGPRNVGKSLLIESLVHNSFTKGRPIACQGGPSTILAIPTASGKEIRLQFVECPNDINGMIDAAKYADVAILMVDASYGFEMETFEFRNLLQVHGFPKVIGVLTHFDKVNVNGISKVKRRLEDHFRTEICEGAKLSSLSGLEDGLYKMPEIDDLEEMLSDDQFLPITWRAKHPYMLVDYFEDFEGYAKSHRMLRLYGYIRGHGFTKESKVHIAGAGDFCIGDVTSLHDPWNLYKGYGIGNYIRLDVHPVPSKIVENFGPHRPILVGGIPLGEKNSGFMQVKLRRHSWHYKLLKTGDPITVSAGWRRYQTTAIYVMEKEDGQHRLLDHTPEHKDCLAVFWGPLEPPNTKIVAVLRGSKRKEAFRITAKGVVLDFDHDARVLQEVETIGIPCRIFGKTASIKFSPELKIDRFIGGTIQTKRGILGKIYKVKGEGGAICKFKDNIDYDDTFLFPVLTPVKLPLLLKRSRTVVDGFDKEVALRQRQMLVPRRRVIIHEGECSFYTDPNPLELFHSVKKLTEKKMTIAEEKRARNNKKESWQRGEKEKMRKIIKKLANEEQKSGEVAEEELILGEVKHSLDRLGEDDEAVRVNDRALPSYVRMYDKELLRSGKGALCY